MNKEKAIKIIQELKNEINKNEMEEAKLYTRTWVIGGLSQIEAKVNGESFYPSYATYEDLFREFAKSFFCINIDPAVRMYAIASMFNINVRNLVVKLCEVLFTLEHRKEICSKNGYIEWDSKWMTEKSRFEVIRREYAPDSMRY